MTKEPKLDRARRQVPEWTKYDDQVAALDKKVAKYLEEFVAAQDVPDLIPDSGDSDDESDDDEEILKGAQKQGKMRKRLIMKPSLVMKTLTMSYDLN